MRPATDDRKDMTTSAKPVWLTGFGSCMDSYFLGERDLAFSTALQQASRRAFKMAGGINTREIGLFELNDAAAYQVPLWGPQRPSG